MLIQPNIISRSAWGSSPLKGAIRTLVNHEYVVVHHAAGYYAKNLNEGKKQVRAIQRLHQVDNRWVDIGYHFLIDAKGNIYQGRAYVGRSAKGESLKLALGAHVCKLNSRKIGVCFLGCYHPPKGDSCKDHLSKASLNASIKLIAYLCNAYNIRPNNIRGHREFCVTACPGNVLHSNLTYIRKGINSKLKNI